MSAQVPAVRALYLISADSDGVPFGVRLCYDTLDRLAESLPLDAVTAALRHEEVELRLAAVHLAPRAARRAAELPDALLEDLCALVGDPTVWELKWGEREHQSKVFVMASLAMESVVYVLQRRVALQRQAQLRARLGRVPIEDAADLVEPVLARCLERAADHANGQDALHVVLRAVRQFYNEERARAAVCERLAGRLAAMASDPTRFARSRWGSLVALDWMVRRVPEADAEHAAFRSAREVALRGVAPALGDDSADIHLRRLVRDNLATLAPELVAELLAARALHPAPLPSPSTLLSPQGTLIAAQVQAASLQATVESVCEGLASESPEEVVAAAALAPVVAQRDARAAVLAALTAAIPRIGAYSHPSTERNISLHAGHFAADRLLHVIAADVRRNQPEAVEAFLRGLAACAARGLNEQLRPDSPIARYMDTTRWGAAEVRPVVLAWLERTIRDTSLPAATRFAALLAERSAEANAVAATIALDPDEDAELRAMIGARLHHWHPEALHPCVLDPDAPLWTPREGFERLPICEPGGRVPLTWLIEALAQTRHTAVRFAATRQIGTRLGARDNAERRDQVMFALRQTASPAMLDGLREIVDDETNPNAPRWSACMALAVCGAAEDDERLVRYVALRGAWTRLDPFSDEIATLDLLEHVTLHPLTLDDPRSMMEPYLVAGFGARHTLRMMARVFVILGHRATAAGHPARARLAFERAHLLDPLNLSARRATRRS